MMLLKLLKWDTFRLLRTLVIGLVLAVLAVAAIVFLEDTGIYVAIAVMGGSGYCIVRSLYAVVIDLHSKSASLLRTIQAPSWMIMLSKMLCMSLISIAMLFPLVLSVMALGFHIVQMQFDFITDTMKWEWIWETFETFPFGEAISFLLLAGVLVSFAYVLAGSLPLLRRFKFLSSLALTVVVFILITRLPFSYGLLAAVTLLLFIGLVLLYQFLYDAM